MRRIACAVLVMLACCRSKPSGVEIVVDSAPSNVKFVRVFLGTSTVMQALGNGTSITVPMPVANATQSGSNVETQTQNIFVRDHGNDDDWLVYDGKPITFELQSSGNGEIYAAIIVGYTGSGDTDVPVASALQANIPLGSNGIAYFHVTLDPAALPFLWSTVANATTPVTHPQCAGYSYANNTAFIVEAADDEDCDGYLDGSADECSMFVYNDQHGVDTTGSTCFVQTPSASNTEHECRLGGHACQDGVGVVSNNGMCMPTDTCAADIACSCTSAIPGLSCLLDPANVTHEGFTCTIGIPAAADCSLELPPPPTGGMLCATQSFKNGLALDGSDAFTKTVDVNGFKYTLTVGESCNATIAIDPDPNSGNGSGSAVPAILMRLALDNGASMVVPVALSVDPVMGACAATQCVRAATDLFDSAFSQCVAGWGQPVPTGLQGTSATLPADMSVMYYIDTGSIMESMPMGSGWTPGIPLSLPIITTPLESIHISLDGNTMYVTEGSGMIYTYANVGGSFTATGTAFVLGSDSPAVSFSPDTDSPQRDILFGDSSHKIYEATSVLGGPPFIANGSASEPGETPYLGDDDDVMWFSYEPTDETYALYATQRGSANQPWIDVLPINELPTSLSAQAPWVSPLDATQPFKQTMFFSIATPSMTLPMIYSVQRAALSY